MVRSFFLICTLTAATMMLVGCQPPSETADGSSSDGDWTIAMIPKGETHIYWKSVHFGARQAADELGVDLQWKGPSKENDRDEQISVMQSFLNRQVDGICLCPLDADALVRPVAEAGRGKVPVVIFDSGLSDTSGTVSYVATDNFRGGQMAGDAMAKALGEKGNVVVMRYQKGSESTHQREEGFLEAIGKYPDMTVISSDQYGGSTTEAAIDKSQQIFNKFGDEIDGIFASCEPTAAGILQTLRDRKSAGDVALVAFDSSETLRKAMADGEVTAIVLQDPVRMGYLSIQTMVQHLRGEDVQRRVDTGVFVATPDNMDDEKIRSLLQPGQA
ncbi:ABC transporter substrate-binding protein [Crateriforma spongiae]|uniref:ABC transporter substrate-binding protein n=1 Tax=Crateriforma spongiae TaxID=2724528 RepID=UPI001447E7F2|nr:substrate-binding domain-containing protein [Crateriforma spongiae]